LGATGMTAPPSARRKYPEATTHRAAWLFLEQLDSATRRPALGWISRRRRSTALFC
jgi:hypothetical protein